MHAIFKCQLYFILRYTNLTYLLYVKNERIEINNTDGASIRHLLFDNEKILFFLFFTNFRVLNLNLDVKIRLKFNIKV